MGKRVAIIGAGVSGLMGIKTCLEYNLEPVCFEKFHDIGGLWYYKPDGAFDEASVMKSTIINTSKEAMAFSDFPPPAEFPNFMHNRFILDYFRMYAEKFGCIPYIKFKTTVMKVKRSDDYEETGNWDVTYQPEGASEPTTECFNAVLICTGHHAQPYVAKIPGIDNFKGLVKHSHEYKEARNDYTDKNVAVVGIGNSGGDISVELGRNGVAKQVYVVTRRGTWIINRVGPKGMPADVHYHRYSFSWLFKNFPGLVNWLLERQLQEAVDHDLYGIKPSYKPLQQHPFVQDDLANRILSGGIIIKPDIKNFTEDGAMFVDGTEEKLDAVILATGYSFGYPFLEEGIIPVKENQVSLYKYMMQPNLHHPETLAIIGLIQPYGAIMPIAELQCRVFAEFLTGQSKMPTANEMVVDIVEKKEAMEERYFASRRHTIQVDWIPFMEELAALIGATPPGLRDLIFTDPRLALALYTGPIMPYVYRLKGPHSWSKARETALSFTDRIKAPLMASRTMVADTNESIGFRIVLIIALVSIIWFWFW